MCPCSHLCPALHQNQLGNQGEAEGSFFPLCSCEMLPGVLHPPVGSPAEERCGCVGMSPEEGHKNGQGAQGPLLRGKAVQSGEKNVLGDLIKRDYKRAEEGFFARARSNRI